MRVTETDPSTAGDKSKVSGSEGLAAACMGHCLRVQRVLPWNYILFWSKLPIRYRYSVGLDLTPAAAGVLYDDPY